MLSGEVNGTSSAGATRDWHVDPDHFAFAPRKLRVICVGAGFSGLILAHKVKHEWDCSDYLDLAIYDKNSEVGGTWLENVYPGVGCDIPAHSYILPFEPNPNWSKFYVGGHEIKKYILDTTDKYDLRDRITFDTTVVKSHWDEDQGKWKLELERDGTRFQDEAHILINGSGLLNKWQFPRIEGLDSFEGKLLHSARWDPTYDWTGKRIAVIGNGSSALQIVPATQPKATKLVNYIRHPTWVSPGLCGNLTRDGMGTNFKYTDEEKETFRNDPAEFLKYRKKVEDAVNSVFSLMLYNSPGNDFLTNLVNTSMKARLSRRPELIEKLLPEYPVGCRRISPGNGYLEALQEDNARPCFSNIKRITKTGIVTDEGEEEFDLIVCATGFDTSFTPKWDLQGRDGRRLDVDWAETPEAYLSICAARTPNYFVFAGPNAPIGHGSLTQTLDWSAEYMHQWIKKIAKEDIKSIAVKDSIVRAYNAYAQENLKRLVWSGSCHSWYKGHKGEGAPVSAMYPGSCVHFKAMVDNIRGEDFDIQYNTSNPFQFMGNGELDFERAEAPDLSFFLKPHKA